MFLWKAAQARARPLWELRPMVIQAPTLPWSLTHLSSCRCEKGKAGTEGKSNESKERLVTLCNWAGEKMKGSMYTSGAFSSCSRCQLAPRGAEAQGCCDYLLLCSFWTDMWVELLGLLTAKDMNLKGTINFAQLFLSQVKSWNELVPSPLSKRGVFCLF